MSAAAAEVCVHGHKGWPDSMHAGRGHVCTYVPRACTGMCG